MITLHNYEEYFVRYLDGELSSQERAVVTAFLQAHPELQPEMEAYRATRLPAGETFSFPDKEALKRGITPANIESYLIRRIEQDLSAAEGVELDNFLSAHPEWQPAAAAYQATILQADNTLAFPEKYALKKPEGRVIPIYARYVTAALAAACLLLVFMLRGIQWGPEVNNPIARQPVISHAPSGATLPEQKGQLPSQEFASNGKEAAGNNQMAEAQSNERGKEHMENAAGKNPTAPATQVAAKNAAVPEHEMLASIETGEMSMLQTGLQPINYLPRVRKAQARMVNEGGDALVAEANNHLKFSTVAAGVGSSLLRLSGRAEYLNSTMAFGDDARNNGRQPLTLSIKGSKFDFYHKFFKKRSQDSSTSKQSRS